ncbi:urease accessory protein UreE [Plectonema cf. radiosum LEGE 06105]|uniref:Urease accessory protein UreE n=1 Tax=Plectonema cf. radiosum LEGE 06105 TaxID=945769 RepID=A0A8J7K3N7_9CYAN|nr:urease accessory protein UreE [Plectonema radiosum]MBE9215911.1 urease accessory protein UreE [Plectonema cf. radiosum LEGE 06105]
MLTFTQFQLSKSDLAVNLTLSLTAEERTRSRYRFPADDGQMVCLCLPRGTILKDGDILEDETNNISIKIIAKPEPVLTVTAQSQLNLIKAAYHLGNRHVKLEITPNYLRLSPSKVLRQMLENLSLQVTEEVLPFQPETGAYGQHHPH